MLGDGRHPARTAPPAIASSGDQPSERAVTVLQVLAGYLFAVLVAGLTGAVGAAVTGESEGVVALLAGQVGFWAVLVAVVVYARSRPGAASVRGRFGDEMRAIDLPVGVAAGVVTQLVLLPALYFPFRSFFDQEELSAPAEDLLNGLGGVGLMAMGVGVVVIAPLVEELFFRGLLLETMRHRWNTVVAVVASSVFFGATHLQPLQFAGLSLAGFVFAGAVVRTGRLGSAIAVHVGFNATTFAALVLF